MNSRVYIFGTSHDFQVENERFAAYSAAFRTVIKERCARLRIAVLAEEMSLEALQQRGQPETVCQEVARCMSLLHRFCDPDSAAREEHGIRQEGDLHLEVFFGRLKPEELDSAIRNEHAKREALWLGELQRLNAWPVLFVCGAKHVAPFSRLLAQDGLAAEVLVADWAPTGALT